MSHAVSRLRDARLVRAVKPFQARGQRWAARCPRCRVALSHCLCSLHPQLATHAGMCLLMADTEALKPTNTGWLVADVVTDTYAFDWARTAVDPALLALLANPQWQGYVVFPAARSASERVVTTLASPTPLAAGPARRPLFVLLDGTWKQAGKMLRHSPYLNHLPILSLQPGQPSNYRLRHSPHAANLCTAEVAALCLALADDTRAAGVLGAYLDVFTHHYLQAKNQVPVQWDGPAHQRLRALMG